MGTRKETAAFILNELGASDRFYVKSMFGEYALYADGKAVAFICDDQLFVKIMGESESLDTLCERAPAYSGSKDYYLVPESLITSKRDLATLLLGMAEQLPLPKARTKARKK